MSPDLHTALEAAITLRLEVARAVAERVGRVWYAAYYSTMDEWRVRDRATQAPIADVIGGIDAAAELVTEYAVLHDPADAVRRYERDLRVLARYEWADDCLVTYDDLRAEIRDLLDVYPEVTRP